MRTAVSRALVIVIALSVSSTSEAAMQEGKVRTHPVSGASDAQSDSPKGFQLSAHIEIEKETFGPGEPIVLRVSAINNTQKVFYLRDTRHPEFDYEFQVRDENGNDVPLTKEGRDLIEAPAILRQVAVEVKPGEEVRQEFNISKLFNLTPGLITITVKHAAWEESSGFTTVTSNSIKIRVAD